MKAGDNVRRGEARGGQPRAASAETPPHGLSPPPWHALRGRILAQAGAWEQAGQAAAARALRDLETQWWQEQEPWNTRMEALLEVHHEINNALVGVRGNVQLMLMNPAGQSPGSREKLEVVLRESGRIQEATARLRDLRSVFGGPVHRPRAA